MAISLRTGNSRNHSGASFRPNELLRLYRARHHLKPNRSEPTVLLASMRRNRHPTLRLRERELGWFWFRDWPKAKLRSLLKRVDTAQRQGGKATTTRKSIASRCPDGREGLRELLGRVSTNTSGRERADAIRKLAAFRNREDLPLLRSLTKDGRYPTLWAVAEALGQFRRPEDVALLTRLARSMNAGPALELLVSSPSDSAAGTRTKRLPASQSGVVLASVAAPRCTCHLAPTGRGQG